MRNIVIDLGNLEYLYSDTINAFIASNRHMLEVSGRIAILTEHPKVQDILKRAGLDNIMRIYRSEAEMIADAKEILRQTSSYRIEELQKAATGSATIQLPPQVVTPPSIPKGEFDEFRFEMGQQLGAKLDNNEVPQHQHGTPPASGYTPQAPTPPQPTAQPSVPPYQAPVQAPMQNPAVAPNYGQPQAPAYGAGYSNTPAYGNPETQAPAGYGGGYTGGGYLQGGPGVTSPQDPRPDSGAGPFDYPTVQLPVGQYNPSQQAAPTTPPTHPGAQGETDGDEDDLGQRGRKGAEDRMRSPTARKSGSRRVGGREAVGGQAPSPEEAFSAYSAPVAPSAPPPSDPEPTPPSYGPITTPSSLVEEKSSSTKVIVFAVVLAIIGLAIFLFTRGGDEKPAEPQQVQETTPQPPVATPTDTAVAATPSPVEPAAQPATPAPVTTPTAPVEPQAVEPKTPVAKPAETKPTAPVATTKPSKKPKAAKGSKPVEAEAEAPVAEERPTATEPPAEVGNGQIRVVSEPSGAEVLVNFSKKGVTPLTITLGNNTNRIIVRKEGFKRFETTLSKNTAEKELSVDLTPDEGSAPVVAKPPVEEPKEEFVAPEPKPEPKVEAKPEPKVEPKPQPKPKAEPKPEPREEVAVAKPEPREEPKSFTPGNGAPGIIFMSSSPARADIIVDGKETGKKTPVKMELPAGVHRIEMVKSGQRGSVEHTVSEGKNKALHINLQ